MNLACPAGGLCVSWDKKEIESVPGVVIHIPVFVFGIHSERVPLSYFLSHPFITSFVNIASWHTYHLGGSSTFSSPMEYQSILPFLQKSSRFLIKIIQQHVDGNFFGTSIAIVLPVLTAWTNMCMRIFPHSPYDQMNVLECTIKVPFISRRTFNSPIPPSLLMFLLRDTLIHLCPVYISVPSLMTNRLPLQNFCQFMVIVPSTRQTQLL